MTGSSIANSLDAMKVAVKLGHFNEASLIGSSADIPLAILTADMVYGKLLHLGPQSTVHQGVWNGQQVAIKRVFIRTSADLDSFRQELCLMAAAKHSNVVSLLGARALPPDYIMVMPLEPQNVAEELHEAGWRPGAAAVISLATQLAQALEHIHSLGVVHRDLKPANVLLDSTGGLKLTDFGIAELADVLLAEIAERSSLVGVGKPSGGFHKRHMVGTLEYMAPEVLLKEPGSFASDVYAFAVTVNEIATGTFPFSDCTTDNPKAHTVLEMGYGRQELAAAVVGEGLRPLAGESTPEALQSLLDACWQREPSSRPTASQIVAALSQMQEREGAAYPNDVQAPAAHRVAPSATAEDTTTASGVETIASTVEGDKSVHWVLPAPLASPATSSYAPQLSIGAFATAGLRGEDKMEDRHVIAEQLGGNIAMSLVAVFDGHRGAATAEYAAANMLPALQHNWNAHDPAATLSCAFVNMDEDYRRVEAAEYAARVQRMGEGNAGSRSWPGCTAIAALLQGDQLWVANAGDCRAVLCRGGLAMAASRDHNADDDEERRRVVAAGAQVAFRMGNWRVGQAGIQVTRSLGDGDLKDVGLIAEPEVLQFQLSDSDEFLILASDGLWDCMSNDEAIQIVHDTVKEPDMCAQRLATEALTRGSRDNITVVVAFLRPVETIERIYGAGQHKFTVDPTHYGSRGSRG